MLSSQNFIFDRA